jgi:septal ring factor EnvC (AmiA/AmiB activator)
LLADDESLGCVSLKRLEEDVAHAKEGTRAVERSRVELEERLACLSDKLGRCQRAATEDLQAAQAQHDAKVEKIMKEVNQVGHDPQLRKINTCHMLTV